MNGIDEKVEIRPNPGQQEKFLACSADIAIYGGAAGGGKTWALLLEPCRHLDNPDFSAVIFRRTYPEIRNPGGTWDESWKLFPLLDGTPRDSNIDWSFPSGAYVKFAHMQHEKDRFAWQGSQIPLICFDELTHFTRSQFFYMLSRNRSSCGIAPYVRATCNPDPDHWVRDFISWWIDPNTGYPIPERDGVIRYFSREGGNEIVWADTRTELTARGMKPKSATFISANVYDNPILLANNPDYEANLRALPAHERARLLGGNWNARASEGSYFQRSMFEVIDADEVPALGTTVRYWDRAATEPHEANPDPDYTVGLRMRRCGGTYYVMHIERGRWKPARVEERIRQIASQEPLDRVVLEEDPGQAGKAEVAYLIKALAGYDVHAARVITSKESRAVPVASQAQAGNIKIVRGPWNEAFFSEIESFPDPESHKDQVDAFSGAFTHLVLDIRSPSARSLA